MEAIGTSTLAMVKVRSAAASAPRVPSALPGTTMILTRAPRKSQAARSPLTTTTLRPLAAAAGTHLTLPPPPLHPPHPPLRPSPKESQLRVSRAAVAARTTDPTPSRTAAPSPRRQSASARSHLLPLHPLPPHGSLPPPLPPPRLRSRLHPHFLLCPPRDIRVRRGVLARHPTPEESADSFSQSTYCERSMTYRLRPFPIFE